jgi:hypothetical protein
MADRSRESPCAAKRPGSPARVPPPGSPVAPPGPPRCLVPSLQRGFWSVPGRRRRRKGQTAAGRRPLDNHARNASRTPSPAPPAKRQRNPTCTGAAPRVARDIPELRNQVHPNFPRPGRKLGLTPSFASCTARAHDFTAAAVQGEFLAGLDASGSCPVPIRPRDRGRPRDVARRCRRRWDAAMGERSRGGVSRGRRAGRGIGARRAGADGAGIDAAPGRDRRAADAPRRPEVSSKLRHYIKTQKLLIRHPPDVPGCRGRARSRPDLK